MAERMLCAISQLGTVDELARFQVPVAGEGAMGRWLDAKTPRRQVTARGLRPVALHPRLCPL